MLLWTTRSIYFLNECISSWLFRNEIILVLYYESHLIIL
jgi:hypothetical protein